MPEPIKSTSVAQYHPIVLMPTAALTRIVDIIDDAEAARDRLERMLTTAAGRIG